MLAHKGKVFHLVHILYVFEWVTFLGFQWLRKFYLYYSLFANVCLIVSVYLHFFSLKYAKQLVISSIVCAFCYLLSGIWNKSLRFMFVWVLLLLLNTFHITQSLPSTHVLVWSHCDTLKWNFGVFRYYFSFFFFFFLHSTIITHQ